MKQPRRSPPGPFNSNIGPMVARFDGTVLLCLHEWGAHGHPSLMSPNQGTPGNGLLLFFRVDDFDLALQRARSLATRFEEEPHVNPNTQTKEFSLRDPTDISLRSVRSPRRKKGSQLLSTSGSSGKATLPPPASGTPPCAHMQFANGHFPGSATKRSHVIT